MSERCARRTWIIPLLWLALLASHALLAAAAHSLLPRGFPWFHARGVFNQLIPAVLFVVSLASATTLLVRPQLAALALAVYPALWWSATVTLVLVFPITGAAPARATAVIALCVSLAYVPLFRRIGTRKRWLAVPVGAGLLVALLAVRAVRAPEPTTMPFAARVPAPAPQPSEALPDGVTADATGLHLAVAPLRVHIDPQLRFVSRSPDGFWTSFATGAPLPEPPPSTFSARAVGRRSLELESWTALLEPVYSHLNAYLELGVEGHERLALRFSPCPDTIIDVLYADYPSGAPARFAYVDAKRAFYVVEASDAEKGPYHTLAQGTLPRSAALGISLLETAHGTERELLRVTLHDWSTQLSTALSPTAGHGVAQNAAEFRLAARPRASSAHLFVTLAGTGIGRGWDSVGHAAGAYRNRVTVERPP